MPNGRVSKREDSKAEAGQQHSKRGSLMKGRESLRPFPHNSEL